jgi:hypothetical protein
VDEGDRGIITETMIHPIIAQAVFDEAGDTGQQQHSSHYLVIAGVIADDIRPLQRIITHLRRVLGKKARSLQEIKGTEAARDMPRIITRVLTQLAALNVEIHAVVLDKRSVAQPEDTEDWYRAMFALCINRALQNRSSLQVLMDRRYTKSALQQALTLAVLREQPRGTALTIATEDSKVEPALQVADVVAWSIFDRYEHDTDKFYNIIVPCIANEVLVTEWKEK